MAEQDRPEEPEQEHVPFEHYGKEPPAGTAPPRRRQVRRPSPLGLMGPATEEAPKESGLPSLRAVGFMALFIALVLAAVYFVTR
jgi:hypothetical protein